jgi:Ca-activated chloride channel family protein
VGWLAASRLWLLLVVGAVALAYVVQAVRGARRHAVRFTNLDLLASVAPRRPGWRRHLPAALLVLSLTAMVLSLARPTRDERVPRERATVLLAIDVSISMDATDVAPSRLAAAQAAATTFARRLPERINLGLVSFAGSATVRVAPTTDREAVVRAIDRLELAEATAIGDAVLACLDAIEAVPVDGEPVPASVVLMSDGETTVGVPNSRASDAADRARVPITTIAFGTDEGTIRYEGRVLPVPVNEEDLRAIADNTGGATFSAATGEELQSVYEDIGSSVGYETEAREVGRWFTGAALVLATLAALGSLVWFSRIP